MNISRIHVNSICFDLKKAKDQTIVIKDEIAIEATNHEGEQLTMIVHRKDLQNLLDNP